MVSVVFVIGMLNLVFGFAIALMLERRVVVYLPKFRSEPERRPAEPLSQEYIADHVPQEWLEKLKDGNFEVSTLMEASAHVIRLEVGSYREDLLDAEDLIWSVVEQDRDDSLPSAIDELIVVNEDWLARQSEAIRVLSEQRSHLGAYATRGALIESELLEQQPLVKEHCCNLKSVDPALGVAVLEPIMREVSGLVGLAHQLRDVMQATIATVMRDEGRLGTVTPQLSMDGLTGLEARLGIEALFHDWWREDVDRVRLTSVAMIDIDRFGETNARCTTRVGDRILVSLAKLLNERFRAEDESRRVFRYSGQRFLVAFQDTGPRSAAKSVDGFRQLIGAATFQQGEDAVHLTISASVTEVRESDDTVTLLNRLEELVEFAQKDGSSRLALDGDDGPSILSPQKVSVDQPVIVLDQVTLE